MTIREVWEAKDVHKNESTLDLLGQEDFLKALVLNVT